MSNYDYNKKKLFEKGLYKWNLPLWIAERFFSVDVFRSPLCLMWGKSLILLSSILITAAIFKLCKTLRMVEETCWLVCILFITSNFFMSSVILMSAYDGSLFCNNRAGLLF